MVAMIFSELHVKKPHSYRRNLFGGADVTRVVEPSIKKGKKNRARTYENDKKVRSDRQFRTIGLWEKSNKRHQGKTNNSRNDKIAPSGMNFDLIAIGQPNKYAKNMAP